MRSSAEKIPVADFRIGDIPLGTKQRFHLLIDNLPDGQSLIFPAIVARGKQPGKTLLVTGCVHGDEYEGPVAIQDIYEALDVEKMQGTFFGIPVVNGPAFFVGQREGGWDHLNLARIFPGSPNGAPSMRIAHAFQTYVVSQADFYLDIHSGGNAYAMKPFAGYQIRPGKLGQTQKEASIAFGLDLVWGTAPLPGRSLSAAADNNVPAMYVELRGEGRCRPDQLETTKQGVHNVLAYLNIITHDFPTQPPPYCFETPGGESGHLQLDHPAPTSGIFVPAVELWSAVEQGDCLGWIRHPDGTVLAQVNSDRAGRVLFMRTLPRVFSGDFLVYVLALPEGLG